MRTSLATDHLPAERIRRVSGRAKLPESPVFLSLLLKLLSMSTSTKVVLGTIAVAVLLVAVLVGSLAVA